MSPPNQGFKYKASLTAAASDGTGVLVAACGASRGGGIQLSGTWSATLLFEQTLDNGTTWIAKTVYPAAGGAGVTTAAANGQWKFTCGGETHVRVRCSAFTSGTIVADATFTAGVDTKATTTNTTMVDAAGTAVAWGFTPTVITTKTTTLIKTGPGMIGSIAVSLLGTVDTLTVYDALTATGTPILELVSPAVGIKWLEGALFTVGLCIVTGGTTAGKYNVLYA